MNYEPITAAGIDLTAIMNRDDITDINRYVFEDGTTSFRVTISGRDTGYGSTVFEAFNKALDWAERRAA